MGLVKGGTLAPMHPELFRDLKLHHPVVLGRFLNSVKSGALPQRTIGRNNTGEDSMLWWLASQLSSKIIGETPRERLDRGHKAAESRAEKALAKYAHSGSGPALVLQQTTPKVDFKISVVKKKHRDGAVRTSILLEGTDFLGDLNVGANVKAGDVLFDQVIAPGAFNTTRLQQFSYLFDKYLFEDVKFQYNPLVSANTDGGIVAFPDYDPDDDLLPSGGEENVRKAVAHLGYKVDQLWDKQDWELKTLKKDTMLFCDPTTSDDRLTQQGRFTILSATDFAGAVAGAGLVTMKYKCHFFITQMDQQTTVGSAYHATNGASVSAAAPLGSSIIVDPSSNYIVGYGTSGGHSLFTFPGGKNILRWMVIVQFNGTGLTTLTTDLTPGCSIISQLPDVSGATNMSRVYYLSTDGTQNLNQIAFRFSSVTTITSSEIWIFPIPPDFTARRNKFIVKNEVLSLKGQMEELKALLQGRQVQDSSTTKEEDAAQNALDHLILQKVKSLTKT